MKTLLSPLLLAVLSAGGLQADVNYSFNYDSVPSGTPASVFDTDPLRTSYGVFAPDVDAFGSDIPGTDRWRPDTSAPPVTVDDPTSFGGSTTSAPNALNAKFQPILLDFAVPLSSLSFSVRLDGDTFGDFAASVLFLDASGKVVQNVRVDQTQPNALVTATGLNDVSGIVLPGGAFYDNLRLAAVPEAGTTSAGLVLALGGTALVWRRVRSRSRTSC